MDSGGPGQESIGRVGAWALLGPMRARVVAELAAAEGLDGWSAWAAVGVALSDSGSPWVPAVDAAFRAALQAEMGRVGEVLGEGFRLLLEDLVAVLRRVSVPPDRRKVGV